MKVTAVFGPPGTGKTTFLRNIITEEVKSRGDKTAVLSFSKSAAIKLTGAVSHIPGLDIGTIHSLCFNALNLSPSVTAKPEKWAKTVGLDPKEAEWVVSIKSRAENTYMEPEFVYWQCIEGSPFFLSLNEVMDFISMWNEWKEAEFYLDFDDMLLQALGLVRKGDSPFPRYGTVYVDEAQDLTPLQWEVIESLTPERMILAGDDDQAIYSFTGADPHYMSNIYDEKIVLEQSFRVPRRVHELAESIVNRISRREDKRYRPTPKEGIVQFHGFYDPDTHIGGSTWLYRDNYHMEELTDFLKNNYIPYTVRNGYSPFTSQRAEIIRAVRLGNEDFIDTNSYLVDLRWEGKNIPKDTPADEILDLSRMHIDQLEYLMNVDILSDKPVTVSTIHGFKGEEDDHIVLSGMLTPTVESVRDDLESLDNELRVWYVGVTRAKHRLDIVGSNYYIQ